MARSVNIAAWPLVFSRGGMMRRKRISTRINRMSGTPSANVPITVDNPVSSNAESRSKKMAMGVKMSNVVPYLRSTPPVGSAGTLRRAIPINSSKTKIAIRSSNIMNTPIATSSSSLDKHRIAKMGMHIEDIIS